VGTRASSRTAMIPLWLIVALLCPFAERDDCPGAERLYGKIQVVESFADCEVQVVTSFPDLRVQLVDSFADDPGEWQMVESFPDYTVTFVESFADVTIQYVDSFPGTTD